MLPAYTDERYATKLHSERRNALGPAQHQANNRKKGKGSLTLVGRAKLVTWASNRRARPWRWLDAGLGQGAGRDEVVGLGAQVGRTLGLGEETLWIGAPPDPSATGGCSTAPARERGEAAARGRGRGAGRQDRGAGVDSSRRRQLELEGARAHGGAARSFGTGAPMARRKAVIYEAKGREEGERRREARRLAHRGSPGRNAAIDDEEAARR